MSIAPMSPPSRAPWLQTLRRLAVAVLAVVLSLGLAACDGGSAKAPPVISPEAMATIERQTEGLLTAKARLGDLAALVNDRNWVFARNLIHGPLQEVGREMLYLNQQLLPADRPEANARANRLKDALAELDEAARLQDGDRLRKDYIAVASAFGTYLEVVPAEALNTAEANLAAAAAGPSGLVPIAEGESLPIEAPAAG
jgi:photosystem II protein PsbQ